MRDPLRAAVLLLSFTISTRAATALFAFDPAPGKAPTAESTAIWLGVKERIGLAAELYGINANQSSEMESWARSQMPSHAAYVERQKVTLRRRTTALSALVSRMGSISAETRAAVIDRMQDQIYRIQEAAPLSLSNICKRIEATLPSDQVVQGRTTINVKFADQLHGKELVMDQLDRLMLPPVEVGAEGPPLPSRAQDPARHAKPKAASGDELNSAMRRKKPVGPEAEKPKASSTSEEKAKQDEAAKLENRPPPAAFPPAVAPVIPANLEPAPAVESWGAWVRSRTLQYKFDQSQSQTAGEILTGCTARARAFREAHKAEYESARGLTDTAEQQRAVLLLDRQVDLIYNEMKMRVESVASLEQKTAASPEAPAAGASTRPADAK